MRPSRSLAWGIKDSFVDYVRAAPGGRIECAGGARAEGATFVFPAARRRPFGPAVPEGERHFRGEVFFHAHHGMLRVLVRDPVLRPARGGGAGTEIVIDDGNERLVFAVRGEDGVTRLTADGADMFAAGPYEEGTQVDPPFEREA